MCVHRPYSPALEPCWLPTACGAMHSRLGGTQQSQLFFTPFMSMACVQGKLNS